MERPGCWQLRPPRLRAVKTKTRSSSNNRQSLLGILWHRKRPDCWQLRPPRLWAVKTKTRSQGCVPESRRISRIIAAHRERLRINRLWGGAASIGYIDRRLWPVVVACRIEKDVPLSNPDRHDQPYENSKVIRITEK